MVTDEVPHDEAIARLIESAEALGIEIDRAEANARVPRTSPACATAGCAPTTRTSN